MVLLWRRRRVVVEQDATGGTIEVVELTGFECPEKGDETGATHGDRDRNQEQQPGHGARPRRSELRTTSIDEHDIAAAANNGVTKPAIASGTAARL